MSEHAHDDKAEEGFALALTPVAKELFDLVKGKLPPNVEFGLMILTPTRDDSGLARVIAITTNRARVAFAVAQWVLTVDFEK